MVSGISAGAANSCTLGLYEIGKEKEAADFMAEFWLKTTVDMVFKVWPEGIIQGMLHERGLLDNEPMIDTNVAVLSHF